MNRYNCKLFLLKVREYRYHEAEKKMALSMKIDRAI